MIFRPIPTDFSDPVYHRRYIDLVKDEDALEALAKQQQEVRQLFGNLSEAQALFRYAPDKWSLKELLGHSIDTERIMAYRAMALARGEKRPLIGFDENEYAAEARFDRRPLESLRREYTALREANLALFGSFDAEALTQRGTVNDRTITVRALVWIIAGHERHHLNILRERYLPLLPADTTQGR